MKPQKRLVLISLVVMITVTIITALLCEESNSPVFLIETAGQPSIGNPASPIQLVIFEEPKCPFCKEYTQELYPRIKSNYIDTDKIGYTAIMVSFLPKSMLGAVGLMCIYHANPNKADPNSFFSFLDTLYAHQGNEETDWIKPALLLKLAKETLPQIDLAKFENCLNQESYRNQIEKDTRYGRELMKGSLTTPALYINGSFIENLTYREISKRIDALIKKNGSGRAPK